MFCFLVEACHCQLHNFALLRVSPHRFQLICEKLKREEIFMKGKVYFNSNYQQNDCSSIGVPTTPVKLTEVMVA